MSTSDSNNERMTIGKRSRKVACVATLTAAGLSFGLVACGGSSDNADSAQAAAQTTAGLQALPPSGTTGTTGSDSATGGQMPQGTPPAGGPGGIELTAKEEKCLANEGFEMPGSPDSNSSSDGSANSQSAPPDQGSVPDQDAMTAAFEACGIDLPEPPAGGAPAAGAGAQAS